MRLLGLEVHIKSQGTRLKEYDVKSEGPKTIACYIPSTAGEKFEIHMSHRALNDHGITFEVQIDGRSGGKSYVHRSGRRTSRSGMRSSSSTRHAFIFSEIQTTDDDALAVASDGRDVGVLSVAARRSNRLLRCPATVVSANVAQDPGIVHERSKKAGTHCIAFGRGEPCEPRGVVRTDELDPQNNPYAMFVFRYRPEAILRAQGILVKEEVAESHASGSRTQARGGERTAQPAGRSQRSGSSCLSPDIKPKLSSPVKTEDMDSLEAELEALQRRIDRARAAGGSSAAPAVKKEEKPLILKVESAEVIDLTLND